MEFLKGQFGRLLFNIDLCNLFLTMNYEDITIMKMTKRLTPYTQEVNWTYIRRSEDVLDVFWTSYVRSIYALCLRDTFVSWRNIGEVLDFQKNFPVLSPNGKLRVTVDAN